MSNNNAKVLFVYLASLLTVGLMVPACDKAPVETHLVQTGRVTVDPEPNSLNAPWAMAATGGPVMAGNGDSTLVDLSVGEYTLTWGSVSGWTAPVVNPQMFTLAADQSVTLTGVYRQMTAGPSLLLYSTMDSADDIFQPTVATATYSTMSEAIPGPAHVTFEPGRYGNAARFNGNGFTYTWPVDGPVRFHGDNFDFDDPEGDGGRLDFWIKFNVDPHGTYENTWVARSNWGQRYVNYEFAGSSGNTAAMMVDMYSNIVHNERTSYSVFRVTMRFWDVYNDIREGEWHLFTVTWRRNGLHQDELHIYIDGTQEGCESCSDYNGNLPPVGSITDFFFSPQLYDNYILFSIDEVYSFDSWDVSDHTGNFADLQIPEGVTITYPQKKGFPVGGSPVSESPAVFEFFVINDERDECDCDLYLDGAVVESLVTTNHAHTESSPHAVTVGAHTVQVKCENGRLVSPVRDFDVTLP